MKLISALKSGRFEEVFTHDNPPDMNLIAPNKKPYVIFSWPNTPENEKFIYSIPIMGKIGIRKYYGNKVAIVITGKRKVADAINEYLSLGHHADLINTPVKEKLIKLRNELFEQIQKNPTPIPPRSKNKEIFVEEVSSSYKPVAESTHAVKRVKKKSNPHGSHSFFKPNKYPRSISEIEAFNSICYRLLLNDRAAKVKSIHDSFGQKVGLVSKEVKNFSSLHDYYKSHSKNFPSQSSLVEAGYGKILTASYCEEENDLHGGNAAYDEAGKTLTRIDYDQSTWPLTSKYILVDPEAYSEINKAKPVDSFPVTKSDIINFPHLKDAKPYNWPDRRDLNKIDLTNIENNAQFKRDKYLIFLKRILISESVYKNVGNATIGNENTRRKFVEHKVKRTKVLKDKLLEISEFREMVLKDPIIFGDVLREFEIYNSFYKKDRDFSLKVDIEGVKKSFEQLKKDCLLAKNREQIAYEAFCDNYHFEYQYQYRLPRKVSGKTFANIFNHESFKETTIDNITRKLRSSSLFESDRQVERLFNDIYTIFSKETNDNDKNGLIEESARNCIDKIIIDLVKLDKKVRFFITGETVKFGKNTLRLPEGAANMLKYYSSHLSLKKDNPVEMLNTLIKMASNSAKYHGHGFFSRRLPETNDFYKWVSSIAKPHSLPKPQALPAQITQAVILNPTLRIY